MHPKKPVVLCILDGWGIGEKSANNAIYEAKPEFYNKILKKYPHSKIQTSGDSVGLPEGQMGNSEVGHITIGSGRIIEQDLIRISNALANNEFLQNQIHLSQIIKYKKPTHIVGLFSDGGVHSHLDHFINIAQYLADSEVTVYLHLITDGRDTSPYSFKSYLSQIEKLLSNNKIHLSSICGRFYAMDRDNRFERTDTALEALNGKATNSFSSINYFIQNQYNRFNSDEFIEPHIQKEFNGVQDQDNLLFINFRPDRMRQIVNSCHQNFNSSNIYTMTSYSQEIDKFAKVLFTRPAIQNTLGEIISKNKLKQLRIAETEKYPHVTYFFNGGEERKFEFEDRVLIDSPKVKTYDIKPEMSSLDVTNQVVQKASNYDFILVNYANADMVGHTGSLEATKKAITAIDISIETLYKKIVLELGGIILVTADHGNAEEMFNYDTQEIVTSHSLNPVPCILLSNEKNIELQDGYLYDIAPTILKLLDIEIDDSMIGKNLVRRNKDV